MGIGVFLTNLFSVIRKKQSSRQGLWLGLHWEWFLSKGFLTDDSFKSLVMKNKNIDATHNRPKGDRNIDSAVLLVDLPSYIKKIKKEKAWEENDRNAITIFKSEKMRIVLVALHKKAAMQTEHPENIFSLQVLSGKVSVATTYAATEVDEEMIIALHEKVPYTITALKKSIFLLTLAE